MMLAISVAGALMTGAPVHLVAETPAQAQAQVLTGAWKILWFGAGRETRMRVDRAQPAGETVVISGLLESLAGEACPFEGRVAATLAGVYVDQIMTTRHAASAYVLIAASCAGSGVTLDLLGLPAGPVLMSGRAVTSGGQGGVDTVFLGR